MTKTLVYKDVCSPEWELHVALDGTFYTSYCYGNERQSFTQYGTNDDVAQQFFNELLED